MDDARRVWEGMDRASGRRVATRLSQAGLSAAERAGSVRRVPAAEIVGHKRL